MVEIKNLQFNYRKKKPLINGLNLSLEAGNVYGLLGKNGAGKSTLLKIMGGLIFPKNGDCTVFGLAPQNRNPDFLSEIYFIPEEFYLPPLAISKFVTVYGAFYPRFSETQFYGYLAEYGLTEKDKLNQLSYGQKKKVLIGFGLATNCKLLLMDEPTNGLDIPSKSQFRKTMASSVSPERTFIISTHQVRDLESLIDPIIIMDKGEIVFNESTMSISQKLKFELRKSSTMTNDDIFSQPVFGGSYVVSANKGGEETNVELEVLFNAINSNRDQVNQIFKS